jgi:hypothetical protein
VSGILFPGAAVPPRAFVLFNGTGEFQMSVKRFVSCGLRCLVAAGCLSAVAIGVSRVRGEDAKAKSSIKEIMKNDNKGDDSIVKQIIAGKGTADQVSKLQADYKLLPDLQPPRGDKASWKTKSAALLEATDGLKLDDKASIAKFKDAVSCRQCHSVHKPLPPAKK